MIRQAIVRYLFDHRPPCLYMSVMSDDVEDRVFYMANLDGFPTTKYIVKIVGERIELLTIVAHHQGPSQMDEFRVSEQCELCDAAGFEHILQTIERLV